MDPRTPLFAFVDLFPSSASGWISTAILACTTWMVKQTISNTQRLAAHEETDNVRFEHIKESLGSLKAGQCADSGKLDQLIDHLMFGAQAPRSMSPLQSHLVTSLKDLKRDE